ncbi:MAG: response regulator [Planctomycetota bacterium]
MLDKLDAGSPGDAASNRLFSRWSYRMDNVRLKITHPGGSESEVSVACRNLSAGGIGFLHNTYLHPESSVAVILPHPSRGDVELVGSVVRCQHRQGKVHDVAVRFLEPISVREFVGEEILTDQYSLESIDPEQLRGNVLHVEGNELDRRIVQHFLRPTGLVVRHAETGAQGLELAQQPCDVIILSDELPDMPGPSFLSAIRGGGSMVPTILTGTESGPDAVHAAKIAKADAVMAKPIRQDQLLRAMAEFLTLPDAGNDSDDAQAVSANAQHVIERLHELGSELNGAIRDNDALNCYLLCQQIRSLAPRAGLRRLVPLAESAGKEVSSDMGVESCMTQLLDLAIECQSASLNAAA